MPATVAPPLCGSGLPVARLVLLVVIMMTMMLVVIMMTMVTLQVRVGVVLILIMHVFFMDFLHEI